MCKKCSNSYYEYIDKITEQDIKNNIIPPIYKRYNLRVTYQRTNNRLVKLLTYFIKQVDKTKKVNDLICKKCADKCNREKKDKNFLALKLFNSICITKIFNIMISDDYLEELKLLMQVNPKFKNTVKLKLVTFRNYSVLYPMDYYWKGADYYYKKIYGISSLLDNIIPLDIYTQRNMLYLNDSICGHPMASHGWYQESLYNLIAMNII